MAIWVMAVVAVALCPCFSPGGQEIISPGRMSFLGQPQHCTQPQPDVTSKCCPSGCICHAVRAPGSNVTKAKDTPRIRCLEERINPHVAGKICFRPFRGRL